MALRFLDDKVEFIEVSLDLDNDNASMRQISVIKGIKINPINEKHLSNMKRRERGMKK